MNTRYIVSAVVSGNPAPCFIKGEGARHCVSFCSYYFLRHINAVRVTHFKIKRDQQFLWGCGICIGGVLWPDCSEVLVNEATTVYDHAYDSIAISPFSNAQGEGSRMSVRDSFFHNRGSYPYSSLLLRKICEKIGALRFNEEHNWWDRKGFPVMTQPHSLEWM